METNEKSIKYDAIEDLRFPVRLLYKAYYILENRGQNAFYEYVHMINMPAQDIERVMNKYRFKTNHEFRLKIGHILNNIQRKLSKSDLELNLEDEIPF